MFFLKNLIVWLIGVGCLSLGALLPDWAAFGAIGGLLLSAAQMGAALNGSFAKHLVVFLLGMACYAVSISLKTPAVTAALTPIGALMLQMSDLAKILKGVGLQQAGAAVAGNPPEKASAPSLDTSVLRAPPKGDDEITADERPRR